MQKKNSIHIIIQVRFSSVRLPGKALLKIDGETMLGRLVGRLKKSKYSEIIVSTSTNTNDKKVVNEAKKLKLPYFTGDEEDCLKRFVETGRHFKSDIIVRVTADNPLTDPYYLDRACDHLLLQKLDYVNIKGLPLGTASEVVRLNVLEGIDSKIGKNNKHREHITSYIYTHPKNFSIGHISPSNPYLNKNNLRLTVDTRKDFELIENIYNRLGNDPALEDIISLLESDNRLKSINKDIKQKTL